MKKTPTITTESAAEFRKLLLGQSLQDQATEIADSTVRSNIEIHAREVRIDDLTYYDTSAAREGSRQGFDAIQRALRYIDKRGDALPFVMKRHIGCKALVWFEDKAAEVLA